VLSDRNVLNSKHKYFPWTTKCRRHEPSKNWTLDFKEKFRRSAIRTASGTVDNDSVDFSDFAAHIVERDMTKKTVRVGVVRADEQSVHKIVVYRSTAAALKSSYSPEQASCL
jgi:hypothetical protein